MVEITLLEFHFEDASFDAGLPFGGGGEGQETDAVETPETNEDTSGRGVPVAALAALAGLLVVFGLAALAKYLTGEDPPEVEIDTADDENRPIGVTLSDDE